MLLPQTRLDGEVGEPPFLVARDHLDRDPRPLMDRPDDVVAVPSDPHPRGPDSGNRPHAESASLLVLGACQQVRDVTDLGLHPGLGDDHLPASSRDRRVHVSDARPVAEGDIGPLHWLGGLPDREALPRERRLLDLERGGHEDPAVGRDNVAGFHQDDVAGHEVARVDLDHLTVATDPGDRLHHLGEGLHALLGLRFLA